MTEENNSSVDTSLEAPKPKKALSFFSILSFIAGIGTYVWFFGMVSSKPILTFLLTPFFALIAVITGHKGRHDIRKSLMDMKGKTLANIGLLLGYVIILTGIFIIVLAVMGVVTIAGLLGS
ncbi:MAG TPA: DUF4190 domain-containing protein [Anaerolineaceae bacterium]|jgi:small-conductance mechanosensitive channel|nr:DUF4190 domain-containing protein [Anaerolineaceae bacterium]HOS53048.1 DUF4190 domain-containing protein [Anaerolineaceae bacterium]HPD62001.1 DUF4190 domain-containing protein [Anaerolineaceae bacterium]HQK04341.1 DUF4190 domain-containing protein [Anaerolineaceae bacterium]HQM55523.1 DUF4190 domain-containing protein [Anaerolineaceae bacterium]